MDPITFFGEFVSYLEKKDSLYQCCNIHIWYFRSSKLEVKQPKPQSSVFGSVVELKINFAFVGFCQRKNFWYIELFVFFFIQIRSNATHPSPSFDHPVVVYKKKNFMTLSYWEHFINGTTNCFRTSARL